MSLDSIRRFDIQISSADSNATRPRYVVLMAQFPCHEHTRAHTHTCPYIYMRVCVFIDTYRHYSYRTRIAYTHASTCKKFLFKLSITHWMNEFYSRKLSWKQTTNQKLIIMFIIANSWKTPQHSYTVRYVVLETGVDINTETHQTEMNSWRQRELLCLICFPFICLFLQK